MPMTSTLIERFISAKLSFEDALLEHAELSTLARDIRDHCPSALSGQHVGLLDGNPLHFSLKFFLLLDLGAIPVLLSSTLTEFQLSKIRENNPDWHFWLDTFEPAKIVKQAEFEQCFASMTSGSTGRPKLCYLSVKNSFLNARMHGNSLGLNSSYQCIQTLPVYHSFGIVCYLFSLLEFEFSLDFNRVFLGLKSLNKRTLNKAFLHLSPAQARFILKEKSSPPEGIAMISVGGGRIGANDLEQLHAKLPLSKLFITYGLTEAGPRVSTSEVKKNFNNSIGYPLEQVECRVLVDSDVRDHGVGQLVIKSPTLKLNLNEDEVFGEYLLTRDRVDIHPSGEIFYLGRESDIINRGGVTLYVSDIEDSVREFPGVLDACSISIQHSIYGEVVALAVEGRDLLIDDLKEFLKTRLSSLQFPSQLIVLDQLPRTGLGKIDRTKLMELFNEQT
jgi:fatty-acyl-CoA synthase